ncbi:MAG: hypothetical protein KGM97_09390 [Alphaproteobacteria bacterium]|nr:hypothetical protein [Alphaproteobacteria bacterium]MDE2631188.1 hypothetical protein [Alphaproteobacteria bacterium]
MATAERLAQSARSDSVFFPAMAAAMALTVFAGFSRTFYLRGMFAPPPLSTLMIVHGTVFTAWIALLATQTGLVAANRRDLHMKLGILGTAIAALMVVLGTMLAIDALRRGSAPAGAPSPIVFFAIPMFAIATFPVLVGIGIANRARPAWHKRFMILSSVALVTAAIARIPLGFIESGGPPVFFALADLFIAAMALYDWATLRRVHPATLWAGAILIAAQPLCLIVGATPAWHAFATWTLSL